MKPCGPKCVYCREGRKPMHQREIQKTLEAQKKSTIRNSVHIVRQANKSLINTWKTD